MTRRHIATFSESFCSSVLGDEIMFRKKYASSATTCKNVVGVHVVSQAINFACRSRLHKKQVSVGKAVLLRLFCFSQDPVQTSTSGPKRPSNPRCGSTERQGPQQLLCCLLLAPPIPRNRGLPSLSVSASAYAMQRTDATPSRALPAPQDLRTPGCSVKRISLCSCRRCGGRVLCLPRSAVFVKD